MRSRRDGLAQALLRRSGRWWPGIVLVLPGGCGFQQYAPKPIDPAAYVDVYEQRDLISPKLRDFFTECGLPNSPWPPAGWDGNALQCAGLYFHPAVAQARAEVEVARAQEITAGQRPNPVLDFALEHHSDESEGPTPWSIGTSIGVVIERPSRRIARIERAVAQTSAARIDLDGRAWQVRSAVRDRLLDYADAQLRSDLLAEQTQLLAQGVGLLERRAELGFTTAVEVSVMRIEAQRTQLARSAALAKLKTAEAALAASIGLPIVALRPVAIEFERYATLPALVTPEAAVLQQEALGARSDIRKALQQYVMAEKTLAEEIARQYPDIIVSPGYFFDQADNVWSLGAALILPLLNRNAGPIAEAQARRESAASAVQSVQAAIIGDIQTAHADYQALRQSAEEAEAIIAGLSQQQARLERQFESGEIDRLALVRAQLETISARLARAELMTEVWRGLFRLEDATQTSLGGAAAGTGAGA